MIQYLKTSWPTTMKWCVIALVLLAPGALIVVPILWIGRWFKAYRSAPATADQKSPAEQTPDAIRQPLTSADSRQPSAASG